MIVPIILGVLLAVAMLLLMYASHENSNLEFTALQHQQSATKMAMRIIKMQDARALAEDPEMLAMLIFYSDKVHGANLHEGRSLEDLTEYLKARPYCRIDTAERLIKAATAHKWHTY